ncbi:tyrosine--tRNA ligase [Schlesneria paludicola]|uniref:tyrosine--tRNA ligase n=1 Tax=Schlesneria paludicola TaxID=360056 RepID=UPI00029A5612|nr:tyrosine--tRNA ligase [Schlesneria paludicola]
MNFPPVEEQLATIRRGVEKIVPEDELAVKLTKSRETGKPLRIKYGIDPTGIDVHLGHTVPLRKMRQFQELGHQAVIIIGNYTAMVGDPSGRDQARSKKLTEAEVEANAHDYLNQVGKVVDISKAEVHRNGDWFAKMNFADILQLCGKITVAQLLTRDDFAKRYANQSAIYLHECLYPMMQAWDSVMIQSDIELGGTEQLYSFMLARDLQRDQGLPQQIGIMSPILVGTDGEQKMGKSLGNYIGISESPFDMMKKFMQIPDATMGMYFQLLTNVPLDQIATILAGHPKEAKIRLAKAVITGYHSASLADEAADRWQREVGGGELPTDIPVVTLKLTELIEKLPQCQADLVAGKLSAAQLLKVTGLVGSTSDAMRLIAQGGMSVYHGDVPTPVTDSKAVLTLQSGMLVKAGKKKIARLQIEIS